MPLRYQWNGKAARYRDPVTGQFITRDQVRSWVDRLINAAERRMQTASDEYRQNVISLAEWQEIMRTEIKNVHLATEALLRGGWNQMTPADYGRVGAYVREQYQYLDQFTRELRNGTAPTDGRFFVRAKMYAKSARVAFHKGQEKQLDGLGYSEERNVLHPAEHCNDCLDMSAIGWAPIGTLIPIGQRQCMSNDRCSMRYR